MNLVRLRYFLAIVDEGSFTRAAERVSVAQPAISQQIAKLETEVGERLFHRRSRSVTLTQAGQALLPHARAIFTHVDHARQDIAAITGLVTGRLSIGMVQPLPDRQFLRLIGAFRRDHPGVELTLMEDETDALLAALHHGQVDIAVIGLGRHDPAPRHLDLTLLAREPVVVATHPDHPLAARNSVTLRALRREPIITLTSASKLRDTLETACRDAGFTPHIVAETSHLDVVIDLVAEGLGIAILPQSALRSSDHVAQLTLSRPRLERRLLLASPPTETTPATRALLELAHDSYAASVER